jgi:2'-5' RNA ligase
MSSYSFNGHKRTFYYPAAREAKSRKGEHQLMSNESAIIVPIPEVEPVVGPLRWQYDVGARLGIPAHITLLYPFRRALAAVDEIERLRDVCASIRAFPFSFIEVRRFPHTAYLYPDKSEIFAQITRTLGSIWPDCKPYNGAFADVIPHLTVADRVDLEILSAVEDSLRHQLPIRCMAREIGLLTSDREGMWSKQASFPLTVKNG